MKEFLEILVDDDVLLHLSSDLGPSKMIRPVKMEGPDAMFFPLYPVKI